MKPICIIPARGGSKRLPRKNILPVNGAPMITYVLATALKSNLFSHVIVSTDDEEIREVTDRSGAECFLRDPKLGEDRATVAQVVCEVLNNYNQTLFCCIYATAALLRIPTLKNSFATFANNPSCDVLMGVSSYNYPPAQALIIDSNGRAELMLPKYHGVQSQFQPDTRVSNGTFYWGRRNIFLKEQTFYSPNLCTFDVPDQEVQDVDDESDYMVLQQKMMDLQIYGKRE